MKQAGTTSYKERLLESFDIIKIPQKLVLSTHLKPQKKKHHRHFFSRTSTKGNESNQSNLIAKNLVNKNEYHYYKKSKEILETLQKSKRISFEKTHRLNNKTKKLHCHDYLKSIENSFQVLNRRVMSLDKTIESCDKKKKSVRFSTNVSLLK